MSNGLDTFADIDICRHRSFDHLICAILLGIDYEGGSTDLAVKQCMQPPMSALYIIYIYIYATSCFDDSVSTRLPNQTQTLLS